MGTALPGRGIFSPLLLRYARALSKASLNFLTASSLLAPTPAGPGQFKFCAS